MVWGVAVQRRVSGLTLEWLVDGREADGAVYIDWVYMRESRWEVGGWRERR